MSNKQCPMCKSYHTKKMVSGRINNVINVYIVIMFSRTVVDKKQSLQSHYGINMFLKSRPIVH